MAADKYLSEIFAKLRELSIFFRRLGVNGDHFQDWLQKIQNSTPPKVMVWELRHMNKVTGMNGWLDFLIDHCDGHRVTGEEATKLMDHAQVLCGQLMAACDEYLAQLG